MTLFRDMLQRHLDRCSLGRPTTPFRCAHTMRWAVKSWGFEWRLLECSKLDYPPWLPLSAPWVRVPSPATPPPSTLRWYLRGL